MRKIRLQGFTIVELMISISIMLVAVVMICTMYSFMLKVSQKGIYISTATSIADRVMNETVSVKSSALHKILVEKQTYGFNSCGNVISGQFPYYYIMEVKPLAGEYVNMRLVHMDLVVFWRSDESFDQDLISGLAAGSIDKFLATVADKTTAASTGCMYRRFTRIVRVPEE